MKKIKVCKKSLNELLNYYINELDYNDKMFKIVRMSYVHGNLSKKEYLHKRKCYEEIIGSISRKGDCCSQALIALSNYENNF